MGSALSIDMEMLHAKMGEEIEILNAMYQDHSSCAARRICVRSTFAYLEVLGCIIREMATKLMIKHIKDSGHIPVTEAAALSDYAYNLNAQGVVEMQERSAYPFGCHFAFSLRTFAKYAQVDVNYIQGSGWDAFKKAIKIRNRIAHPKTPEHLSVSEDEFKIVENAFMWASHACADVMMRSPFYITGEHNDNNLL